MHKSLLLTLLGLGDKTSRNLAIAYEHSTGLSYGEETITESNLLQICQNHPSTVHVQTFSKAKESSTTGADWEWHIIGKVHTLKMRVQAKRVNKLGHLKIKQKSAKAKYQQIVCLIKDAEANNMKPVYCFYSAENNRKFWKAKPSKSSEVTHEYGCLMVDAYKVKNVSVKKFNQIENFCIPWHYLISPIEISTKRSIIFEKFLNTHKQVKFQDIYKLIDNCRLPKYKNTFPSSSALNDPNLDLTDLVGVSKTNPKHYKDGNSDTSSTQYRKMSSHQKEKTDVDLTEEYIKRGVSLVMKIYVDSFDSLRDRMF